MITLTRSLLGKGSLLLLLAGVLLLAMISEALVTINQMEQTHLAVSRARLVVQNVHALRDVLDGTPPADGAAADIWRSYRISAFNRLYARLKDDLAPNMLADLEQLSLTFHDLTNQQSNDLGLSSPAGPLKSETERRLQGLVGKLQQVADYNLTLAGDQVRQNKMLIVILLVLGVGGGGIIGGFLLVLLFQSINQSRMSVLITGLTVSSSTPGAILPYLHRLDEWGDLARLLDQMQRRLNGRGAVSPCIPARREPQSPQMVAEAVQAALCAPAPVHSSPRENWFARHRRSLQEGNLRYATASYIAALALIGVIAIISHVIIDNIVSEQQGTAQIVNMSGRQRMLSQRISRLALESLSAPSPEQRRETLDSLRQSLALMQKAHDSLSRGNRDLGIDPPSRPEIRAIYFQAPMQLDQKVQRFFALTETFLDNSMTGDPRATVQEMLAMARQPILQALDTAVYQYQRDSEQAIHQLRLVLYGLLGLMLVTLGAEAVFIFRPLFRRLRQTQIEASTDSLTGLYNRRALGAQAVREIERHRRFMRSLSVIAIDIDHFKSVNDRYGHAVGDIVLCGIANLMKLECRDIDICARLGGEEFAIIVPETDWLDAAQLAERLRLAVENWTMLLPNSAGRLSVTVSLGISGINEEDTLDSALERADHALYKAKQSGRNMVVIDDPACGLVTLEEMAAMIRV